MNMDRYIISTHGDITTVLDTQKSRYWQLNEVTALVFKMARSEKTTDEIVKQILIEYEVEKDVAYEDVTRILEELRSAHLLR